MELKQEHILFFAFAILAIVVLWEIKQKIPLETASDPVATSPDAMQSNLQTPDNTDEAPAYLTYNAPYAFAPPVVSALPETTSGQIGEKATLVLCGGNA